MHRFNLIGIGSVAGLILGQVLSIQAAEAADTGDAPKGYGKASHEVIEHSVHLGRRAPDDNEPLDSVDADADDAEDGSAGGVDDEDGINRMPMLVQNQKSWSVNTWASNPGEASATLIGWVDFDGDGRFSADEASSAIVPAGADHVKFKLRWRELSGITTNYSGVTYLRFRVTTDELGAYDAVGSATDGEVEDYMYEILDDVDGDEIPDRDDEDNDNDGIPDQVEVIGTDTDGDGTPDYLDSDSDNDNVPDFVEAGSAPANPVDTDGDGQPDYIDQDSDNDGRPDSARFTGDDDGDGIVGELEGLGDSDGDGVPNTDDIDSDNDLIPDSVEVGEDPSAPLDTDGDRVPDFLDRDSDNDGVPDLLESNGGEFDVGLLDADGDGRLDANRNVGRNGFDDAAETFPDSGIPTFAIADTDNDGIRDYLDVDSDGDTVSDAAEAGGNDDDANGVVDELADMDDDGIPDAADVDLTGGLDSDADGIDDGFDADMMAHQDTDGDGIVDEVDADVDGDGVVDGLVNALSGGGSLPDSDGDAVPDLRDADAVGGLGPSGGTDTLTDELVDVDTSVGETAGSGPKDDVGSGSQTVETGLSGYGGCSIAGPVRTDPLLPALALATLLFAAVRRRRVVSLRFIARFAKE